MPAITALFWDVGGVLLTNAWDRTERAKALELRAATDLAALCIDQQKREQALDLLAPIYESFTEGFDTRDMKQAKALLDKLR